MASRAEKESPFERYDLRETAYARRGVVERLSKQTQAAARDSRALGEAGRELQGDGSQRLADDLVSFVIYHARSCRLELLAPMPIGE